MIMMLEMLTIKMLIMMITLHNEQSSSGGVDVDDNDAQNNAQNYNDEDADHDDNTPSGVK